MSKQRIIVSKMDIEIFPIETITVHPVYESLYYQEPKVNT